MNVPSPTHEDLSIQKSRLEYRKALVGLVISGITLAITLGSLFPAKPEPKSTTPEPRVIVVRQEAGPAVVHHVHRFPYFEKLLTEVLASQAGAEMMAGGVNLDGLDIPLPEPREKPAVEASGDEAGDSAGEQPTASAHDAPADAVPRWVLLGIGGAAASVLLWSLGLALRRPMPAA